MGVASPPHKYFALPQLSSLFNTAIQVLALYHLKVFPKAVGKWFQMLLINFNRKQNKRLYQLCNCGFAPKNTFPFSQSTTTRHLCDFLQQKQLQKLVIKALNLEQVFQIPTEKDIIFCHNNYSTRTFKEWILDKNPDVLFALLALSVSTNLVSSTARVTSMEST